MVAKLGGDTVVDAKEGAVLSQEGHSGPFAGSGASVDGMRK